MPSLLDSLNEQQLQAVTSDSSIILNLAGAGSGKTRVLTHRMAYLHQEKRVGTGNMLALTFTRLAAKEMKERVMKLVGTSEGYKLTIGTFHSFCVQVLKEWGHLVSLEKNFTIYTEDDRRAIIQSCIEELGYKVKMQDVLDNLYTIFPDESTISRVASEYYYRLKRNNAVDLDGLLFFTKEALAFTQVQMSLQSRYRYVFVDEFQDTNDIQLEIIQLLNPDNLFVVGDDAQSIYQFRGANVQNIIDFPNKYPGCEVIKLERNYRSTKQIVLASNTLIKHNVSQTEKKLVTDRDGADITYLVMPDESIEAVNVADMISAEYRLTETWSDIAVLARTNRQLQKIKEVLDQRNISSLIISSQDDVFKKDDIRKIIAFIETALNPMDDMNIRKVINFPEARVTDLEIQNLEFVALELGRSLSEAMYLVTEKENRFLSLLKLIKEITEENETALEVIKETIQKLDLRFHYYDLGLNNRNDDMDTMLHEVEKWQNVQESLGESGGIYSFLKWIKTKDVQEKLVQEKVDAVKLMTVHASKGLEFTVVFVIGMNQGVFPSKRTEDLEEERRLFYVAITRAKDRLYLTRPEQRETYPGGPMKLQVESQFIREIQVEQTKGTNKPQRKAVDFGWLE
ncbi:ATP-dependent helicase [Desulfosporosinus sp. OT]|uniref:ATP-dependent helicase n=1 Tax=Desulfosporosinus sp. OT TaxID=913865 RepID=UPI000223A4EF|nr:ATP-dependent helicase [Desulfosporosinus sp. OT]EGW36496.1 uvrD/REP helicase family protein [Desulfosporosinus sp. OT]